MRRNRLITWLKKHYRILTGKPENGKQVQKELDDILYELNQNRLRLKEITQTMRVETKVMEKIVEENNHAVRPCSDSSH